MSGILKNRRRTETERPPLFVELYELQPTGEQNADDEVYDAEWKETGRWMKYEQAVEGPDNEFGNPQVAPLSFRSLNQLRRCIENGVVELDLPFNTFYQICDTLADTMLESIRGANDTGEIEEIEMLKSTLLRNHSRARETTTNLVPKLLNGIGNSARKLSAVNVSIMFRHSRPCSNRVVPYQSPDRNPTANRRPTWCSLANKNAHSAHKVLGRKSERLIWRHSEKPNGYDHHIRSGKVRPRSVSAPCIWTVKQSTLPRYKHLDESDSIVSYQASPNVCGARSFSASANNSRPSRGLPPHVPISQTTSGSGSREGQLGPNRGFRHSIAPNINFFYDSRNLSNRNLFDQVPDGSDSVQVFVGPLPSLTRIRCGIVRLSEPAVIPELLDAQIPIKLLAFILGPKWDHTDYHELGRSLCSFLSNEVFYDVAYNPKATRNDILQALEDFSDYSLVVPPVRITDKNLLKVTDLQRAFRKRQKLKDEQESQQPYSNGALDLSTITERNEPFAHRETSLDPPLSAKDDPEKQTIVQPAYEPLKRRGIPLYGVYMDIKERLPYYWSDFKDAIKFQCLTSLFFMFFAAFAPAIAFGGILGEATKDHMGVSETLIAQSICGIIWGIFAAQPLLIVAATGPVFVFEGALFDICDKLEIDFLSFRIWVAVWIVVIAAVVVSFEASFLIRYVSRFTEDIFALLISIIFIKQSLGFMIKNFTTYHPVEDDNYYCCNNPTFYQYLSVDDVCNGTLQERYTGHGNGAMNDNDSDRCGFGRNQHYFDQPDTALLSAVLLVGTFALAYCFMKIRTSYYFGRRLRNMIGDFGVPISIIVVGMFDLLVFTKPFLQRLDMPDEINVTCDGRTWVVDPMGWEADIPTYAIFIAIIPAFLVFILLFVETEITQLLLGKPEKGLSKGSGGFHWDMLLVSMCTLLCSFFGLPWMCAAAVQSLAHASSLSVMKKVAPGERPTVEKVIEQRVTTIGVAILVGACAFLGSILRRIPISILFGVFLYLGVINMQGIQFLKRIALLIVPKKHFPNDAYCKNVATYRMHCYTLIQIICFITVFLVKYYHESAIVFPLVMMLICAFRLVIIPRIFTKSEITALDGEDEEEVAELDYENVDFYQQAHGFGM